MVQNLESTTNSENKAIAEIKQGDLTRFADLYEIYFERIYRFVYYRTLHKELTEDLVSKTFLKSLESISEFDNNMGTFSAWLHRIARNVVFDHFRTSHPALDLEAALHVRAKGLPEEQIETRLSLEKVVKYLKTLTGDQRDLVIMRVWDGLSYAEISAITGKSEAGIKMAYSRIMGKLRTAVPNAVLGLIFLAQLIKD